MISHKHLRSAIEDIYLNDNKITEELFLRLINEFRYSNLYIPAKRQDGRLNFIIYEDESAKIKANLPFAKIKLWACDETDHTTDS